jgi:hypothetical protein
MGMVAEHRQRVMQAAGLEQAEYDARWAATVAYVAKNEALLSRPRYAPDDKATEITSSSIDEQDT